MTDAVWLTPGYPWTAEPVGGLFYRTQAQALARRACATTVLSPTPWAPWPLSQMQARWRNYARAPRLADDGKVVVSRPRYVNVPGQPNWALPDRMLARAAWGARADWAGAKLVHGHSVVEGMAAWRVARRAGLPLVLTFHGSDINSWPDAHPDRLEDLRSAVRSAGAVIAVSAALAERVRQVTGVPAQHMPIGVDLRSLADRSLPRQQARQRLGLPDDRVVVLFVGNLLRAKGVRELADAIVRIGQPLLGLFVGDGPEAGYGALGADPAALLRYVGPRPHDEVVRYMCAADVFVLPSYSEGLPTVLVEAGALGLPVIASSAGGIPELLAGDRGTVLPEVSPEAVSEAIGRFLGARDVAAASARRLRAHVADAYDVDVNAGRLIDCYRSVTGGEFPRSA